MILIQTHIDVLLQTIAGSLTFGTAIGLITAAILEAQHERHAHYRRVVIEQLEAALDAAEAAR